MPKSTPKLVEVMFLGPTHRLEAFGQFVERNTSALFTEAEAFALQADSRIQIDVLGAHRGDDTPDGATPSEPAADVGEGQPGTHEKEE